MAQQRLRDYQNPLGSFMHNLANLGFHFPGRFCGFDTLVPTGQLQFSLNHKASGITTVDVAGNPYGPLGVVMSRQGEIIIEDAPITGLLINSNAGNNNPRLDLVVLNHQYVQIANPAAATYSIVQGPTNQPNTSGPITAFQVVVGFIYIPANATLISQCTYTKAPCPDSGDQPDAKLGLPNAFSAINMNADAGLVNAPTASDPGYGSTQLWDFPSTGNTFRILPNATVNIDALRIAGINQQDGAEINLVINQYVRIRAGMLVSNGIPAQTSYYPIQFSSQLATATDLINGQPYSVINPVGNQSSIWIVSMVRVLNNWYVKSVDGVGFNRGGFPKGMSVKVQWAITDVLNHVDATGLGINDWLGWQLSNGNLGTLDKRGRVGVCATDMPSAGQPAVSASLLPPGYAALSMGNFGGSPVVTLQRANLPNIQLRLINSATGNSPYYYNDASGGSFQSLKGDSDNSGQNGYLLTEALGNGSSFGIATPYVVEYDIVKL